MRSVAQYAAQLRALLPVGRAWPTSLEAMLHRLLDAFAEEYVRLDGRAETFLRELDPRNADQLLAEWEEALGFPDDCSADAQTLQQRRGLVHQRFTDAGGQSVNHLIEAAAANGFEITIDELYPFRVGEPSGEVGTPVLSGVFAWAFEVMAPEETLTYFRAGESTGGERLADFGNALLECVIDRIKPAHTIAIYTYGS